jgi:hypothetical protein
MKKCYVLSLRAPYVSRKGANDRKKVNQIQHLEQLKAQVDSLFNSQVIQL